MGARARERWAWRPGTQGKGARERETWVWRPGTQEKGVRGRGGWAGRPEARGQGGRWGAREKDALGTSRRGGANVVLWTRRLGCERDEAAQGRTGGKVS
ncbi:hypothetical protein GCM10022248_47270 [Nonomuraea soli]